MNQKPVTIIGGGIWGSLLALRMKESQPYTKFRLLEPSNQLGGGLSWLSTHVQPWMKPLITQTWNEYKVDFPKFQKKLNSSFSLMHADQFEKTVKGILKDELVLNADINMDYLLQKSSFVIDTRNNYYFKSDSFHKVLELEVELMDPHSIKVPVLLKAEGGEFEEFHYHQYIPLTEKTLLVRDHRYSSKTAMLTDDFEASLRYALSKQAMVIKSIKRKESLIQRIPEEILDLQSSNRVLSLGNIVHSTTGDPVADAIKLIDKMVKAPFRFKELGEVIREYQRGREKYQKYLRVLNKSRYRSMKSIFQLPSEVREKFFIGEVDFMDLSSTLTKTIWKKAGPETVKILDTQIDLLQNHPPKVLISH
jgi:lycopene beta-cyclase